MSHYVLVEDSLYRIYVLVGGRRRHVVGPKFTDPREAGRYVDRLDATPLVSPLRYPRGESHVEGAPTPLASSPLSTAVDSPRGQPRG